MLLKKTAFAAAVLCAGIGGADAASPGFCANYSTAAVNQARIAHSKPRCAPGAIGARYSLDYRVHYSWCLGAAPMAANAERGHRTRLLQMCR